MSVEATCAELGIAPSDAVRTFIQAFGSVGGFPFDLRGREPVGKRVGMFADRTLVADWDAFDSMDDEIAEDADA